MLAASKEPDRQEIELRASQKAATIAYQVQALSAVDSLEPLHDTQLNTVSGWTLTRTYAPASQRSMAKRSNAVTPRFPVLTMTWSITE